jgi:hypothetical protein
VKAPTRRHVIAALLLSTLLLSLWLALQPQSQPDSEVVAAAPARPRPSATAPDRPAQPASSRSHAPAGRSAWPQASDAALAAWSPPPPPAAPPQPPAAAPKAKAPTFPYQWIGQLDDGETPQALLSSPQRSFGVRAGDVLEGRWRVERIATRGLQVTWLPTGDLVDVVAR